MVSWLVDNSEKDTKSGDVRSQEEAAQIRDAALKRMLETPPQPHAEGKKEEKRK